MTKPLVLCILDGCGIRENTDGKYRVILCELTSGRKKYEDSREKFLRSGELIINIMKKLDMDIFKIDCLLLGKIKNNVLLIYIILIAIFLGILIALISTWYLTHKNDIKIQGGVYIKGVDVSELTKEEAKGTVQAYLNEVMSDYVIFKYNNYEEKNR